MNVDLFKLLINVYIIHRLLILLNVLNVILVIMFKVILDAHKELNQLLLIVYLKNFLILVNVLIHIIMLVQQVVINVKLNH